MHETRDRTSCTGKTQRDRGGEGGGRGDRDGEYIKKKKKRIHAIRKEKKILNKKKRKGHFITLKSTFTFRM